MPRPIQLRSLLAGRVSKRYKPYGQRTHNRRPLGMQLDLLGLTRGSRDQEPSWPDMIMQGQRRRSGRRRGTRSRSRRSSRRYNRAHEENVAPDEEPETAESTTPLRAGKGSSPSAAQKEDSSTVVTLHTNPNFNVDISPTSKADKKCNKNEGVSANKMEEHESLNDPQTSKSQNNPEKADSCPKSNCSEETLSLAGSEIIARKAAETSAKEEKPSTSKQST